MGDSAGCVRPYLPGRHEGHPSVGANMTTMNDLEKSAFDALNDFAGSALVFLWEGEVSADNAATANGSGTVLRTPGGRLFVLTARHVFEDDSNGEPQTFERAQTVKYAVGGRAVQFGKADALGEQHWHPSVDVAIALLKPDVATHFADAALSVDMVAKTADDATEGHMTMICGFPAGYRRTAIDHQNKKVDHGLASVTYSTDVEGQDNKGRHRVRWGEAEMTGTVPMQARDSAAARQLGIKPGQVFDLAHPGGISGGPLWRFRKVPKNEVWEPSKLARIVGIASTYLEPHSFAPSVSTWGDWLRDAIAKIDAEVC